jgi:hypothetical protein
MKRAKKIKRKSIYDNWTEKDWDEYMLTLYGAGALWPTQDEILNDVTKAITETEK